MSDPTTRLNVVLCWHMHQPHYFDAARGEYRQPWTYLHGIKDYVDMAAHLEAVPTARAVVNFAPVLLDQLVDYAEQVAAFLIDGTPIRDPLLGALAAPVMPSSAGERRRIVAACRRSNEPRVIGRFAPYRELLALADWLDDHPGHDAYVDGDRFLGDLLVWYHLAWLGESVRRHDPRVAGWAQQASGYSLHDRRELLGLVGELLAGIVPRYRRLAEAGRVELSTSPYAHPILPLLVDFGAARESQPGCELPAVDGYPGGAARARWQIEQGVATFERHFGFPPAGCWPSEGAVSRGALELVAQAGLRWVASGERVLRNSLGLDDGAGSDPRKPWLHRPYDLGGGLRGFFRDDGLSDLIGFSYADWHADDAVANLVHHLENIAGYCGDRPDSVVSIVLDGENAWDHYSENGYHFLAQLYRRLASHPGLRLTTWSERLDEAVAPAAPLPRLVAGSWVYGTLSTWIGDPDKNRAWEMLVDAKRAYDRALEGGRLDAEQRRAATVQLALCEGSDWFWWFGDCNPAAAVSDFETLYRAQLARLYLLLGEEPPEYLTRPFAHGGGQAERGGTMRRGG